MQSIAFHTSYITFGETTDATLDQDYPKGDHFFYIQEGGFEYVTIWNRITGKAVVPRTAYDSLYNAATSAPFASADELRDALRANFFIEQSSGTGTMETPTLFEVSSAATSPSDNTINTDNGFYVGGAITGRVMEMLDPDHLVIGGNVTTDPKLDMRKGPGLKNISFLLNNSQIAIESAGGDNITLSTSNGGQPAQIDIQEGLTTMSVNGGAARIGLDSTGGSMDAIIDAQRVKLPQVHTGDVPPVQTGATCVVTTDTEGVLSFTDVLKSAIGEDKITWGKDVELPAAGGGTTPSQEVMLHGKQCAYAVQGANAADGPWKDEVAGTSFDTATIAGYLRIALFDTSGVFSKTVRVPFIDDVSL